jgi:hypothetical protein
VSCPTEGRRRANLSALLFKEQVDRNYGLVGGWFYCLFEWGRLQFWQWSRV